jgi:hypothetical protein
MLGFQRLFPKVVGNNEEEGEGKKLVKSVNNVKMEGQIKKKKQTIKKRAKRKKKKVRTTKKGKKAVVGLQTAQASD